MAELKYDVVKEIGIISEGANNWAKEVNLVSWNEKPAKIDIRDWNEEKTRMSKGITLTLEEINNLHKLLNNNIDIINNELSE